MIDSSELERIWKEVVLAKFKVLSEGNEENHKKTSFRIFGVLAEI
jgi:hypothetical protein